MGKAEARERLSAEIERIVTHAVRMRSIVRTGYFAGMLAVAYAETGLSTSDIIDAIADAAARRGVAVEITRPQDDT